MTQAFNLSQLANKVNTSGQLDASTGLSSAVPVANGGLALTSIAAKSIPVANSANTYTTVTPAAGQSVRVNAGNTAWEAFTPGTVNSITAGGGLTGGTITSSGTIAVDTSTYAIGQVILGRPQNITSYGVGSTVSGSSLYSCNATMYWWLTGNTWGCVSMGTGYSPPLVNVGTWKCISPAVQAQSDYGLVGAWVRIS